MKFEVGQEVIVAQVENPEFRGPAAGSRTTITEAPAVPRNWFEEFVTSVAPGVFYRTDGRWMMFESHLRPLPDEKPADADFQEDLKQWLAPKREVQYE